MILVLFMLIEDTMANKTNDYYGLSPCRRCIFLVYSSLFSCRMLYKSLIFATVAVCMAAPIDEPIRVDLPVYDQPEASSDMKLAESLHPENRGGERSDKPLVGHLISQKLHAVSGALGSKLNAGHLVCIYSKPVPIRPEISIKSDYLQVL